MYDDDFVEFFVPLLRRSEATCIPRGDNGYKSGGIEVTSRGGNRYKNGGTEVTSPGENRYKAVAGTEVTSRAVAKAETAELSSRGESRYKSGGIASVKSVSQLRRTTTDSPRRWQPAERSRDDRILLSPPYQSPRSL